MAPVKTPQGSASIQLSRISQNAVSSQDAQQVLIDALMASDYCECMETLQGGRLAHRDTLTAWIGWVFIYLFLQAALNSRPTTLEHESKIYHRSLQALRRTCGFHGFLPTSRLISEWLSLITAGRIKRPLASDGHSDPWRAGNDRGQILAIKQLRTYEVNDLRHVTKLSRFCDWTEGRPITASHRCLFLRNAARRLRSAGK
jgi:hypothetical protein